MPQPADPEDQDHTAVSMTAGAFRAFKWSLMGEVASRLIAPGVFLVLARLLAPEDFGVVAAATLVISFSQSIVDAGLGKALVQRRDRIEDSANTAFWGNLVLGLLVMILLLVGAPLIAVFFHDGRIAPVTRALALQVPLAALCTVPKALLQRDLAFHELFWVRLLTAGFPAVLSVPMALRGMGHWALVAGAVGGQALQVVVLWQRSRWRPHLGFDRALARELMAFGKWAMLSGVLAWFYVWMDTLVVGHYLGAHDMGLYRTGNAFVALVFGLAFAPLLPVLYSLFSRVGDEPAVVGGALGKAAAVMMMLSLPMAALLVLGRTQIERLAFGPEWVGLGFILSLLAISQGFAWLVGANGEAYRAIGRPDLETWAMGLSTVIYLAAYLASIKHGLRTFVVTRAALVLVGIALQLVVAGRSLGLGPAIWASAVIKPTVFSLVAFAAASAVRLASPASWQNTALQAAVLVVVYAALVARFDRDRLALLRGALNAT